MANQPDKGRKKSSESKGRRKSSEAKATSNTEYETVPSTALEAPFTRKFPCFPGEEESIYESDYCRAKAYLMKQCMETGDSLWDHLNEVLKKILTEQPRNIGDTFEEFSYRVREARFKDKTDHMRDLFVPPEHFSMSQRLMPLLKPTESINDIDKEEDEEEQKVRPDLMELLYFFEQAGVGLPRQEMFCIAVHIKRLVDNPAIEKYRFWGKILGLEKNYYILETELSEEELAKRISEMDEEEEEKKAKKAEAEEAEKNDLKEKRELEMEQAKQREIEFAAERSRAKHLEMIREAQEKGLEEPEPPELEPWPPIPPLPIPPAKSIPPSKKYKKCPSEPPGIGVNKKTYFVCNEPGGDWARLPDITPEQIVIARKIKRSFTGSLNSPMHTSPEFPGLEEHYLRAQIARISSGTQISPLGFYTFNEEEEEPEVEEEGGAKTNYMENPDYEPVSIKDLTDPSMSFWVHHTSYILKQGRTTWWDGKEIKGEEEDEEEGEAEALEDIETGPELLTPLSEDAALDSITPWSARSTSALFPEFAIAIVRSNLWPGAYAFASNKKFENVYIGFGHKFSANNHSPEPMDEIQDEYPIGPEIMEISDPTPEDEQKWAEEWERLHRTEEVFAEEEEEEMEADD